MKNKFQFDYPVNEIFKDIESLNGRAFLVGGIVRDMLLYGKVDYHDVDVEIYGLTIEQLENILNKYGEVNCVGKSFGILKLNFFKSLLLNKCLFSISTACFIFTQSF